MPNLIQPDIDVSSLTEEDYEQLNFVNYNRDSHWNVNKAISRKIGRDAAILLADLLSKMRYFKINGMLDEEGYFFNTAQNRKDDTGLSYYEQRKAVKVLEQAEILHPVIRKGRDAKQRFKFNHKKLHFFTLTSFGYEKNERPVIKKLNNHNNNKNKKNKHKRITSKDVIKASREASSNTTKKFERTSPIPPPSIPKKKALRDFIKPGTGEMSVLLAWNKISAPASVHAANTKTAKTISEYLGQMRSGVFGRGSRRKWDGKWLDKHGIDQREFEEKSWSFLQIRKVIEGPLADMYRDGYWPQDKTRLPRDLPSAFYNPRNQNSFFVLAAYDPPGRIKAKLEDPCPFFTEELAKAKVLRRDMPASDWRRFFEGVRGIGGFLGEIDWENRGAREMFGKRKEKTPYPLLSEYLKWLRGENPDLLQLPKIPDLIHLGMFRPDFWMWRKFMEVVNRYWGRVFRCVRSEERD